MSKLASSDPWDASDRPAIVAGSNCWSEPLMPAGGSYALVGEESVALAGLELITLSIGFLD